MEGNAECVCDERDEVKAAMFGRREKQDDVIHTVVILRTFLELSCSCSWFCVCRDWLLEDTTSGTCGTRTGTALD